MKKIFLLNIIFLFSTFLSTAQVNFQWAKSIGGSFDDIPYSIVSDASGNVYTVGTFSGTADFDPSPGTFNLSSNGKDDIFISKLNSSGSFVWAINLGGANTDAGYSIEVDGSGNLYITGQFDGTVDFDPSPSVLNLTSLGGSDVFVCKFNPAGNLVWAKNVGGTNNDAGASNVVDVGGNVYITGAFQGTVDFDPNASVYNISAVGSADVFVLKLDALGNFVWAGSLGGPNIEDPRSIFLDGAGNVYNRSISRNCRF